MIKKDGTLMLEHLVSMEDLSEAEVEKLIDSAQSYKAGSKEIMPKTEILANMFFEPSTRTHKSFEVAEIRQGYKPINFDAETSSVNKGETLYDTILTMQALGVSACVIRHPEKDYYKELIESPNLDISIINGGDGSGQHPSQSLLDLMTIYENFNKFQGLKIAIAGDLSHSRVAKSNMQILKKLGAELYFVAPDEWYSDEEFSPYGSHVNLDDIIEDLDVLMLLRVQHERHDKASQRSKEEYLNKYGLNQDRYDRLKTDAIIMHPAPVNRGVEIASDLVEANKSRIVEQMTNGVYMRMAILEAVMNYRREVLNKE